MLIPTLIATAFIVLIFYVQDYNTFVSFQQKTEEAWSGIDIQLKRRYNLIPNLVETVKGYAKHEKNTLTEVTKARTAAIKVPKGEVAKQADAENFLNQALRSIFALSEEYPELKANHNFMELQKELSDTEAQIAATRRIFNSHVTKLNTKVRSFPSNSIAKIHGFQTVDYFELAEGEREAAKKVPKITL